MRRRRTDSWNWLTLSMWKRMMNGSMLQTRSQHKMHDPDWELFSCFAHFLHFVVSRVARSTTAFPTLFFAKEGERCAKRAVHPFRHHHVHLTDSVNHSRMKKFGAARCQSWAWRGRVLGWNDPAFCKAPRPNRVAGSFQPTLALER